MSGVFAATYSYIPLQAHRPKTSIRIYIHCTAPFCSFTHSLPGKTKRNTHLCPRMEPTVVFRSTNYSKTRWWNRDLSLLFCEINECVNMIRGGKEWIKKMYRVKVWNWKNQVRRRDRVDVCVCLRWVCIIVHGAECWSGTIKPPLKIYPGETEGGRAAWWREKEKS